MTRRGERPSGAAPRLRRTAVAVMLLGASVAGCADDPSSFSSGEGLLRALEDSPLACEGAPAVGEQQLWSCATAAGVVNARVIEDDETFALTASLLADNLPGQVVIGDDWVAIAPDTGAAAELAEIHGGTVVRSADDVPVP